MNRLVGVGGVNLATMACNAETPTEEFPMASPNDHTHIAKGKRTRRHRVPMTSSSSTGEDRDLLLSSPTTSTTQFSESTEEEEDMANCLILLAHSGGNSNGLSKIHVTREKLIGNGSGMNKKSSGTKVAGSGLYVYECKTCNRCFPSFQALGGHRASHKKPKAVEEKIMTMVATGENSNGNDGGFHKETISPIHHHQQQQVGKSNNNNNNNNKSKVHECSICGSEFSSGQALGGHMRRHRIIPDTQESKKPRNVLALDLNLPAPEDDHPDPSYTKFQNGFADNLARKQTLVFTAASLIDCHY